MTGAIIRRTWMAGVAALLSNPSQGQTTAAAIIDQGRKAATVEDGGEVTVTGLRQQYRGDVPLRALPQSVQSLSATKLAEAGITRLDDALDLASGVSRQNNFGGFFDSFAIRGFAGDENTASNYLLNGFAASRGYGGIRDTSNVERIEIMKGPSSALFGRGEPGGAINIITRKPHLDAFVADMSFGYGSYDRVRGEADLNAPLASGLAIRVTGAYEDADSFRNHIHSMKYTVTPSILWQPAPGTTLSYELEYVRQAAPFDRGIVEVNGRAKGLPRSRFLGEPDNGDSVVDALGHQLQLQRKISRSWSLLLGGSYRDSRLAGFSSDAELADGRQPYYDNTAVATTPILSRQRRYRQYDTNNFVVRGELSGSARTGAVRHHLLLGADHDRYVLDTRQDRFRPGTNANGLTATSAQAQLNSFNAINVFAPVYGILPAVAAFTNQREHQRSWGVYVQDQIDLTDRLKIRLGGRFDHLAQRVSFRLPNAAGSLPLASVQTKRRFSPQIGMSYEVARPLTVYASYSKGFRANSGTGAPDASGAAALFQPEYAEGYEIGAKVAAFDNRLTGTIAVFQMHKSNVLTADPVNAGFSRGLGKARSRGIELDADLTLPAGLRLATTFAFIDAEVRSAAVDPNFGFQLLAGDPLINIPRKSGSVLLFRDIAMGTRMLTLGGGVTYVGRRLGETGYRFPDGSFFMLPAYATTRLHAALTLTKHLRVSGEVTNLFDVYYSPSSYSRAWIMPGAPRQFMIRAGYRF